MVTNKIIIDKIESNKIDKLTRTMRFCSIGLLICAVAKFLMATSIQLSRWGWWLDTLFLIAFPLYFFLKFKRQLTNRSRQFIEWTTDSIIFKLKDDVSSRTIQKNQIETVNINLDIIEIIDKTNQKHLLDISDFDNYDDRLKIKDYFR